MTVIDQNVDRFQHCDPSRRTVVAGFGATGHLHLGHLAVLFLYGSFRTASSGGTIFVSDVGSFFSRDQTWAETRRYREQLVDQLAELGHEEDVDLESDRLSSLLDWTGEIESNDLGATLTLAAVREVAEETDAVLVLFGEDEQKYVERLRKQIDPVADFSYVVVEDLVGPSGEKMSKSRPETCVYVDQVDDRVTPDRHEWYRRLADQLSSIASSLELRDPTTGNDRFANVLAEIRRG